MSDPPRDIQQSVLRFRCFADRLVAGRWPVRPWVRAWLRIWSLVCVLGSTGCTGPGGDQASVGWPATRSGGPDDQVVSSVDGDDIWLSELRALMVQEGLSARVGLDRLQRERLLGHHSARLGLASAAVVEREVVLAAVQSMLTREVAGPGEASVLVQDISDREATDPSGLSSSMLDMSDEEVEEPAHVQEARQRLRAMLEGARGRFPVQLDAQVAERLMWAAPPEALF